MSFKINTSTYSEAAEPKGTLTGETMKISTQIKHPTVSESVSRETIPSEVAASTPSEAVEEKPLSPQFAQLAKRERMFRRELQALKAREASMKAKESEYANKYVPRDQIAEDFRTNPIEAMRKYNLSYDQLTQAALNAPSPQDQTIADLKKEIEALRGGVDETKNLISKQQADAYDQALNQIRMEAKMMVFNDPQFETIKEMKAEESVVELIKETFDKTGTILSVQDAAKEVEDYLLDETLRLVKGRKIQERLNATPAAASEIVAAKAPSSAPKTLTHANVTSPSKGMTNVERAMLAFRGELK